MDNKLKFYQNDELLFEKELDNTIDKWGKVSIMDSNVVIIGKKIISSLDGYQYSDKIFIYDYKGDLVQVIADNSEYFDLAVDSEQKNLVVLKQYIDGICEDIYFSQISCDSKFSYDIYSINNKLDLEGSISKPADGNIDQPIVLPNPDTDDLILLLFIGLVVSSSFLVYKSRKNMF